METIIIICVGIPCSGKSTWSKEQYCPVVSRDTIREMNFKSPYVYSRCNEAIVTCRVDYKVESLLKRSFKKIILDNCHTKESYIDGVIKQYPNNPIQIKFFEVSLFKAHYRNIVRFIKTNKWIPLKVINNMYKNYNNINKLKYAKYISL